MALTKAVAAVDAWAEVAQGAAGIREGATVDCAGMYEAVLHIDAAISEATTETAGAIFYVEVSSNTSGDADWSVLTTLGGPTGVVITADLGATEAAGQTILTVTDPTTANLDNPPRFIFIEDNTAANSEIVYQITNEGDAADTITILDGLLSEHAAATSAMWFIDSATVPNTCVVQYNVVIPMSVSRVRVVYDNTHSTAADIFTRARISSVTAV